MIAMLLALQAVTANVDADAIRALRRESNAAIAAHDLARLRPLLMPDYAGLPGSLGKPLSIEETEARLARAFADPTFVTYDRRSKRIEIAASRKRAIETGLWVGTWRKPDGLMRVSGRYQAFWAPSGGSWKLQNESFVTLECSGSRA